MFNMGKKKKEKKVKENKARLVIEITVVGKHDGAFNLTDIQNAITNLVSSMKDITSFDTKVTHGEPKGL